jgi:hypothetical protein
VSRLGAHHGQASAVCSNRSENNGCLRVRSEGQLARKCSKRVQTGEPNRNALISLDGRWRENAKAFAIRFESSLGSSGNTEGCYHFRCPIMPSTPWVAPFALLVADASILDRLALMLLMD